MYILVSVRENILFESQLVFIYTALEMLIDNFTDEKLFSNNSQYKKLEKLLRNFLSSQSNVNLTDEQLLELTKKLPELRRKSIKSRISQLLSPILRVLHEKFGNDFETEKVLNILFDAVKRRNHFIHKGIVAENIWKDIAIIRYFVCLWIIYRIGYPIDKISRLTDDFIVVEARLNGM